MQGKRTNTSQSQWKRHLWIAVIGGFTIAGTLAGLVAAVNSDQHRVVSNIVFAAQFPGWIACAYLLPGSFESINNVNYIQIAIPVNAAIYAFITFGILYLRSRIGNRVYGVAALFLVAGSGYIASMTYQSAPNHGGPTAHSASELQRYAGNENFGYWGMAFFDDRLFVSTNAGLLELIAGVPREFYRFQKKDSVVSGPWVDAAHHRLWVLDDYTYELLNFDGTSWTRMSMPTPSKGYYSRGDVLEQLQAAASGDSFWITSAGNVWAWDEAGRVWIPQELPELRVEDTVMGTLPVEGELLLVVRHELALSSLLIKPGDRFHSDTVVRHDADGTWTEVPNQTGVPFFAEHWVGAAKSGWLCTREGTLLRVTLTAIDQVTTPSPCDTLTLDSSGTALALFRTEGVYELDDNLKRVAPPPDVPTEDAWVYLARQRSEVGFAVTSKHVSAYRATLWIANPSGVHAIKVR